MIRAVRLLAALAGAGLGLVVVLSAVQLSLIPRWSGQQWFLAVTLPLAALAMQLSGGLTVWWWTHRQPQRSLRR
jgi:hypothetical protein